jgi:hypothetical protein
MKPLVLDLCSGTGGATSAAVARGWDVVRVDIDTQHRADVVADVRTWSWTDRQPMVVWASPPCQEFSRWSMPWTRKRNPPQPDMSILMGCLRIKDECRPDYWIIENVRGAVPFFAPFLGEPRFRFGPFLLWGDFPRPDRAYVALRKEHLSGKDRVGRAAIPANVSEAVFGAIEYDARLFGRMSA